ncbi:MAG: hypothetical protein M1828_007136 [Chrysothrix sp. TS-e1954]|nr:MAG: hypothetical protein M1828_007136 [Chrysothrix sp. TS-e1954]
MSEDRTLLRRRSRTNLEDDTNSTVDSFPVAAVKSKHYGTITIILCSLLSLVLFAYLYAQIAGDLRAHVFANGATSQRDWAPSLDQYLHPEDHIYRKPTTQQYTWHISSSFRAPDGVRKKVYLVNGVFLGPTIETRPGDRLIINVVNHLEEGTALHWHGLHMRGTNEMDGAVGITQCPIAPGGNFTYRFEIDENQHGTFWWHAHDQTERADGLYGGLVVHKPVGESNANENRFSYDEERLLLIGDWYHRPAYEVMAWYMRAGSFGNEPVPDSLLVNGLGAYNCSDYGIATAFKCALTPASLYPALIVDKSKVYRFRVVNVGSLAGFALSISDASMTAVTLDGAHEIEGRSAQTVGFLHPGERVDILVSWPHVIVPESRSELHVELEEGSFRYPNPALTLLHSFPVFDQNTSHVQDRRPGVPTEVPTITFFSLATANASADSTFTLPEADQTILLYAKTKKLAKLHNYPYGFFNQTSWRPQWTPHLPLLALPRSVWDANQLVPFVPSSSNRPAVVDIVINNIDDGSHPFHLHGYDAYILSNCADGSYWGSYNPFTDSARPCGDYNLERPVLRDTVVVPRRGYVVLRFLADNPGIWMLHCHLLWHQAAGMAMAVHVGVRGDAEMSISSGWDSNRSRDLFDSCSR